MVDVDVAALEQAGAELVVLFGSRARDRGREGSDVDLGIVLGPGEPSLDRLDAVRGAIRADGELDLVVLDRADPLLLYEVARDGRPLYESAAGAFERFRVRAVKRYMDTAWIRRLEADALRARYGWMVRPELVRRKLSHLHGYLDELEAFRDVSAEEYTRKGGPRRSVERLLQLVVEVTVDVNVHLVTELTGTPPGDYRASFGEAASCGVLPRELAERLAPSAGLRNVVVHDYTAVDDERIRGAIPLALEGFREYIRVVERWLEGQEDEE